ncbi:MAG: hypothetical protein MJ230_00830 [bacterium]|nr:hypothetical protein [bacterium]
MEEKQNIINVKEIIDIIRQKYSIKRVSKNNVIDIAKCNKKRIKLDIVGENNTISIPTELKNNAKIHIRIFGDDNKIIIKEGFTLSNKISILIGQNHKNFGKVTNSEFIIDENTSIESMNYITFNSNTYCHIGKNCMFSFYIKLYNTDGHPIFDKDTGKLVNKVKGIEIGDHCWIGYGATILKNSIVPPNSIIGWNAVFSGG